MSDNVFNSVIDNINVITTITGAPANISALKPAYQLGDFCLSQDGSAYICTIAGRPGTWTEIGSRLSPPLDVPDGGTGQITLTAHGVLVGAGTSPVTQLAVGGLNTVLQGAAGADPSFTATPTVTTLTTTGILTVSSGGAAITGNSSIVGTLTGLTGLTLASGTLALGSNTVSGTPTWSSNQAITLSTAAQPNVTSLGTLTALAVSGTLTLTGATVAGTPTWSSNQAITLSTAAQPNVTSLGTLTSLNITGTPVLLNLIQNTSAQANILLSNTADNSGRIIAAASNNLYLIPATGQNLFIWSNTKGANAFTLFDTTGLATASFGLSVAGGLTLTDTGASILGTSATSLTVGNTPLNPVLTIDSSQTTQAAGLIISGKAAGSGIFASAQSSGTNEALHLNSKGNSQLVLQDVGTGSVLSSKDMAITGNLTFSGATRAIWTSDAQTLQIGTNATAVITIVSGGGVQVGAPGDPGAGNLAAVGQIYTPTQTLTDATTIAWNMNTGAVAVVTLGGNRTLGAPTNLKNGATYALTVKQDGTGTRTLAYNAVFKWPGGTAPVLSTAINAIDILTFISDGTNLYGTSQKAFA